ncbi:pre-rRNA processing protein [Grosmannia clavigera kw1407]|uniref:rRNA biogenesis protein RRP36 n=1 Tax=Grosmannia clavigera (strain kw1407 / UAMH 11150) TaxID=655863 RepID=F0XLT7_GROCL|nr:pre-rRNA processing protein [Grosmannia clavigera kw1407]EFX01417.1 pre-rRNA processing protein [Grosmannia clavigera kw1407]
MDSKRRKLGVEKAERHSRPVKRAKVDETDMFEDEEEQLESEEDAFSGRREKDAAKRKAGGSGTKAASEPAADEDKETAAEKGKVKQRAAPRTSKHAPAEVTSRFAVKRGRNWLSGDATIAGVDVRPAEMRSRDPRFLLASMSGPASRKDTLRARRNYAFLDEYRDGEMQQLRETLTTAERAVKSVRKSAAKRGRSGGSLPPQQQQRLEAAEAAAEELKRKLASMEARKRDRQAKDREQDVLEEHKKRERELVRQGKKPFFLKRSEQRKQLLVDQFSSMSEQQVDKAMDRRRKKVASRERREMPLVRRG